MLVPGTEDIYPQSWDEFVGQDKAVRELKVKIKAAQKEGRRLDHVLLRAPSAGIGKSSLAYLIAVAMGARIWPISGQPSMAELRRTFAMMQDGDILFYDEIHKAADGNKAKAEWMLHVLWDGVFMGPLGPEPIPDITVIGATTDPDKLPGPVLDRFMVQPELLPYTDAEGAGIAKVMADRLLVRKGLPQISDEVALAVAQAASNRPRWMRRILTSLRDLAQADEIVVSAEGDYDLTEALSFVGVSRDGLTADAMHYLRALYVEMRSEPAGLALLKERTGLHPDGIAEIERLLLNKGLIAKTKQGRILTRHGLGRSIEVFGTDAGRG